MCFQFYKVVQIHQSGKVGNYTIFQFRAAFKCVEALGRINIRGTPYPPSNAIIYMHLQL